MFFECFPTDAPWPPRCRVDPRPFYVKMLIMSVLPACWNSRLTPTKSSHLRLLFLACHHPHAIWAQQGMDFGHGNSYGKRWFTTASGKTTNRTSALRPGENYTRTVDQAAGCCVPGLNPEHGSDRLTHRCRRRAARFQLCHLSLE